MDLLGLFFVFRGGEGGGVAAVDSLGNEPSALGVPFILEVIKQIYWVSVVWALNKWTHYQNSNTFDRCIIFLMKAT